MKKANTLSAAKNQKVADLIKGTSSLRISRNSTRIASKRCVGSPPTVVLYSNIASKKCDIRHAENFWVSGFEFKFNTAPGTVVSSGCGPYWSEDMGRQDNVAIHPVRIDYTNLFWFFIPEHVARHSLPYEKL